MRMSRYAGATALLLVLGAPAYAQSIVQLTNPGATSFFNTAFDSINLSNAANVNVAGTTASSIVTQVANIDVNLVSTGDVTGSFDIFQGAGRYVYDGATRFGNLSLSIDNQISATTGSALTSNATAGGTQLGQIQVNAVDVLASAGAVGSISQSAGIDGNFLFFPQDGPSLLISNSMTATVQNGNATVAGSSFDENNVLVPGGGQYAFGSLNTASVGIDTTLTLDVKQVLSGVNSIGLGNVAIANSIASGSQLLDPTVKDLDQIAVANINSLSFSTAITTNAVGEPGDVGYVPAVYAVGSVALSGLQDGRAVDGPFTRMTDITIGNVAAAFTGASAGIDVMDPATYNVGSPAAGNGIALISNVNQTAAVQINTISGGPGVDVSLTGPGAIGPALAPAFAQTFNAEFGDDFAIYNLDGEFGGVVNLAVARTNVGTATISNSSQTFITSMNSVSTGGALSGGLIQDAANYQTSFENLAIASSVVGPATLSNVSQTMSQTLNTVSAGSVANLSLVQSANNIQLANLNTQTASGSSLGSITGALQVSNLGVNVVTAAALTPGTGTLSQTANNVSLNSANVLSASGYNASISGVQASFASVNVFTK